MNLADFRKQNPQYDDMPDTDLAEALHAKFYSDMPKEQFMRDAGIAKQEATKQQSGADVFMRRAGLLGRAGLTGLTGSVGLLADAANYIDNKAKGTENPRPSEWIQQQFDKLGLPRAETTDEKIMTGIADIGTGIVADPISLASKADALRKATPAVMERVKTLRNAQDMGFRLSPSEAGSSVTGRVLEGFSGSGTLNSLLKQKNLTAGDKVMRAVAGTDELNREALNNAISETYRATYQPIEALGKIPTGGVYRHALDDVLRDYTNASFKNVHPPKDLTDLVEAHRVKSFDAADAVDRVKKLRENASTSFKQGNDDLGRANLGIAEAIENNIELNLAKNPAFADAGGPALIDTFKQGRAKMARQYAVRDAIVEGSGSADLAKLAQGLQQYKKPYTGELDTMARFANTAPHLVGPTQGTSIPINKWEGGVALSGLAASPFTGGMSNFAMAYPVANVGIRELLASRVGQGLFSQASAPRPLPMMVRGAPAAYALGSGLFGTE